MAVDLAALPDDVDALSALVAAQAEALADKDAILAQRDAELTGERLLVQRLRLQLDRLRRMQFGRSSEQPGARERDAPLRRPARSCIDLLASS